MWNEKSINELKTRRAAHAAGGGAARVEKQHASGKMTAYERLEYLFDRGTFTEVNTLVESRINDFGMDKKKVLGDGVVTGYGRIGGKLVFASSQDFTVGGGSLGEAQAQKICRIMDMAYDNRAPFVSVNDSGGARIEEGIDSLSGYAGIFYRHSRFSGVIPQIAVIMGPCAGGACYAPALCDFIFMTEKTSQMYITGPAVIKAVTGETVTTDELGGAGFRIKRRRYRPRAARVVPITVARAVVVRTLSERTIGIKRLIDERGGRRQHEVVVGKERIRIVTEVAAELAHEGFELALVRDRAHLRLTGKILRDELAADVYLAAVHTRGGEIAHARSVLAADAEHDYASARLVFAEVRAGTAAHHYFGNGGAVLLHVDAHAPARIALDEYAAAALPRTSMRQPSIYAPRALPGVPFITMLLPLAPAAI